MYAIYGNIYHQYTPVMLAYIPYDWIRHGYCPIVVDPGIMMWSLDPRKEVAENSGFYRIGQL